MECNVDENVVDLAMPRKFLEQRQRVPTVVFEVTLSKLAQPQRIVLNYAQCQHVSVEHAAAHTTVRNRNHRKHLRHHAFDTKSSSASNP